jgi:hypothetical protein
VVIFVPATALSTIFPVVYMWAFRRRTISRCRHIGSWTRREFASARIPKASSSTLEQSGSFSDLTAPAKFGRLSACKTEALTRPWFVLLVRRRSIDRSDPGDDLPDIVSGLALSHRRHGSNYALGHFAAVTVLLQFVRTERDQAEESVIIAARVGPLEMDTCCHHRSRHGSRRSPRSCTFCGLRQRLWQNPDRGFFARLRPDFDGRQGASGLGRSNGAGI